MSIFFRNQVSFGSLKFQVFRQRVCANKCSKILAVSNFLLLDYDFPKQICICNPDTAKYLIHILSKFALIYFSFI